MTNKDDNPYRWWLITSQRFPSGTPAKVRVLKPNGLIGYAIANFELHPDDGFTQYRWEDLDGTKHNLNYYHAWAFLKKDGGMVSITGRRFK